MDVDSDSERNKQPWNAQAQERVHTANELGRSVKRMEKTGGGEEGEDHGSHKVGCGVGSG